MTKTDKKLKTLITNFNFKNPTKADLKPLIPYLTNRLEEDLEDFEGKLIGKWNAIKTLWELSQLSDPE